MRRLLTSHWQLKLVSLLLAAVLWAVVMKEEKVVTMVHAPVELTHLPPDLVVTNEVEGLVSVKIRGAKSLILSFVPPQIELPQGQSHRLRVGENYLPIDPRQIPTPRGIEVLGVTPSSLRVVLERIMEKELPVEPRLEGLPAPGFRVKRTIVTPARVVVRGPERTLRVASRIITEPISLEGKRESFEQMADLESPGNHVSWKDEDCSRVKVLVEIAREGM
jgi:YbbR domain-containing protein